LPQRRVRVKGKQDRHGKTNKDKGSLKKKVQPQPTQTPRKKKSVVVLRMGAGGRVQVKQAEPKMVASEPLLPWKEGFRECNKTEGWGKKNKGSNTNLIVRRRHCWEEVLDGL